MTGISSIELHFNTENAGCALRFIFWCARGSCPAPCRAKDAGKAGLQDQGSALERPVLLQQRIRIEVAACENEAFIRRICSTVTGIAYGSLKCGNHKLNAMISCGVGLLGRASR
jgi:hypothetical protein